MSEGVLGDEHPLLLYQPYPKSQTTQYEELSIAKITIGPSISRKISKSTHPHRSGVERLTNGGKVMGSNPINGLDVSKFYSPTHMSD